jgi:O-antigen ligase
LLAIAWWPRSRVPLGISAGVVAIVVGVAVLGGADAVQKYWDNVRAGNVLSYRDALGRVALAAWEQHPWFGVGMDNFGRITPEQVRAWNAAAGRPHDPARYFFSSHAHNLYANTLAERGAVGFAVLAAVLIAWAVSLARYRPGRDSPDEEWRVWGCALAAWIVSTLAGLVNTTLHHENGMIAVLLLGLWLSRFPASRANDVEAAAMR